MKSCLIVDDSKVVRKVARRILEDLHFAIEEAADGKLAMAACLRQMPDVILLDWNMPVMDGLEFVGQLRRESNGGRPKVIFCSVENDIDRIREALTSGADEYIMKPFDGDIVASKLLLAGAL